MGTELEIKASALPSEPLSPDAVLAVLAGRATLRSPVSQLRLEAHYHDTADGRLRRAGWTLRARQEDADIVATTKGPGPLVGGVPQRLEINAPLSRLPAPGDPLPAPLAQALAAAGLELDRWPSPSHRARILRTRVDLEFGGCRAELAIDHGQVEAAGRRSEVRELELELLAGETSGLVEAAVLLGGHLGLRPGGWSKAARGMALLGRLREPRLRDQPSLLERWEHLVDLEERLRLGEAQWAGARTDAVAALVAAGAPAELAEERSGLRARIDSAAHASLLWGLYVAAVRQGAS